jgi:hypothetical protein
MPYHIYISDDPFNQRLDITIPLKGDHPTLGLKLTQCEYRQRPRLTDMALSTPASRIPKWRSQLRNAYLVEFNHHPIYTIEDAIQQICTAREQKIIQAQCKFAVDNSYGVHPHTGVPQLYFDQLNTIAKHIQEIQNETKSTTTINQLTSEPSSTPSDAPENTPTNTPTATPNKAPMGQFFKLSELQKRDECQCPTHALDIRP